MEQTGIVGIAVAHNQEKMSLGYIIILKTKIMA